MHLPPPRVLPALFAAAGGALAGCGTAPDAALVAGRTAALYGTAGPGPGGAPAALPDLPADADLDDYLGFGLRNNAGLRAAFHRWRAALEGVPQATALPDPMFTYQGFVEEIQTRTGPQRQRFSVEQRFPWFGKLGLRGEVASREAEALWWQVLTTQRAVVREIKSAYYEYAYLAQAIGISEENLRLLQQLEPVVQRRVQAGANQEDLLRLQVEIGRVENDLATLRKFRPALSARLGAAMSREQTSPLPLPQLQAPEVSDIDVERLAPLLLQNPELAALREEIGRAQTRAELAGLEGWPDVTVGADYFDTGPALNPSTPGSGDDPWALRVMMNVPIWRGKYAAAVRQAERSEMAARGELADKRSRLHSALMQAAYELDDAARQIRLYHGTLLPRARESFEVTQTSYQAARASVLDVIDAERTLLAFEKSYWRAVSDWAQSLAELEELCGEEVR